MTDYSDISTFLADLSVVCEEMVSRDERLAGLAEDVLGEADQLSEDLRGAPDRVLDEHDRQLVAGAISGLRPLLGELQLAFVPPDRTGVGVDQSDEILRRFRGPIRRLQLVLRQES